jgi:dihydrofolate reductase
MTKVVADISMSLDGFVTGPDPGPKNGLGNGGEALHDWAIRSDDEVDAAVVREATESSGAVVMGRTLFDIVDGPDGWNDEMGYGARLAAQPAFFVVTHQAPERVRLELDFTFVTDGLPAAIEQARAVAAAVGKDVVVMGGGDVIGQCVEAGLINELRIHLAPVVLGGGTPLFKGGGALRLHQQSVLPSSTATHLTYRLGSGQ